MFDYSLCLFAYSSFVIMDYYISFFFCFCTVLLTIAYILCRNEIKREGAGRGNWGTHTDELVQ